MNLLDSIKILAGLREFSEEASRTSFSLGSSKSRNATLKRKAGMDDGEDSSVAPSPRPGGGSKDRLGVEKKEKRGGSVPSTREVSVKIEDGAESVTSSVEGSKRESSSVLFDCTSLSISLASFMTNHNIAVTKHLIYKMHHPFLDTSRPALHLTPLGLPFPSHIQSSSSSSLHHNQNCSIIYIVKCPETRK